MVPRSILFGTGYEKSHPSPKSILATAIPSGREIGQRSGKITGYSHPPTPPYTERNRNKRQPPRQEARGRYARSRLGGSIFHKLATTSRGISTPPGSPRGYFGEGIRRLRRKSGVSSGNRPQGGPVHPPGVTQVDLGYRFAKFALRPGEIARFGILLSCHSTKISYGAGASLVETKFGGQIKKLPHLSRCKNKTGDIPRRHH